ncbi:MAG: hypothetical protein EOM19_04265 [Candidatus Moranbacteria bacterium]|nr:hypothetical protein [Candidatus Moranbacteria bacterium]
MNIRIPSTSLNIPVCMRRLGYSFQKKENNGEMAFIRPLARAGFPRFHIYTKTNMQETLLSIHLDQHKETYGKTTAHNGEYEDDGALKEEIKRIQSLLP